MARLVGPSKAKKSPAFSKLLSVRVNRGQLIAQRWPRKRGRPKSPITRDQNEWFRQANLLAKYAPSADQWMAIEVAKGGPWYPRDLLMSAMKGRLFGAIVIDGQEYKPVALRDDISSDLDFLAGTVKGTIIVRGSDLWEALIAGAAGTVLKSQGPAELPLWGAAGGGGGASLAQCGATGTYAAWAYAFCGFPFTASMDYKITALGTMINAVVDYTYRGYVLEWDNTDKVTDVIAKTSLITATATGRMWLMENLLTDADLVANTRYVIGYAREDGADNYVLPIAMGYAYERYTGLPLKWYDFINHPNPFARIAKAVPAIGDDIDVDDNFFFHMQAIVQV